jgi:hypothetical protein
MNASSNIERFDEALLERLTSKGFKIFPCRADKSPATPHGFHDATSNFAEARELFDRHRGSYIGVATGEGSGVDVLDLDPRHGSEAWLKANHDRLPVTRTHATRSGGLHLVFRHAAGVRNSAGRIAPGCDVRGEGGYVIWWPAACFPVANRRHLADWPDWLLVEIKPPPWQPTVDLHAIAGNGYANAALRRGVEAVERAAPGSRNDTLNREAFSVARFVLNRAIGLQTIVDAFAAAGIRAGLPAKEVASTLHSAFRARGVLP